MMYRIQHHTIVINIDMKTRNFVQKYLKRFCRATVEVDRKKESKKGYVKHKGMEDGETRYK